MPVHWLDWSGWPRLPGALNNVTVHSTIFMWDRSKLLFFCVEHAALAQPRPFEVMDLSRYFISSERWNAHYVDCSHLRPASVATVTRKFGSNR